MPVSALAQSQRRLTSRRSIWRASAPSRLSGGSTPRGSPAGRRFDASVLPPIFSRSRVTDFLCVGAADRIAVPSYQTRGSRATWDFAA